MVTLPFFISVAMLFMAKTGIGEVQAISSMIVHSRVHLVDLHFLDTDARIE